MSKPKTLICVQLLGGMDGMNLLTPRDQMTIDQLTEKRSGAPGNLLNLADTLTRGTVSITAGSDLITNINVTGVVVGDRVYGDLIEARRNLTVIAVTPASNTVQMSGPSWATSGSTNVTFGKATTTLPLATPDRTDQTARKPSLHHSQGYLYDMYKVTPTVGNENKMKAAFVANISTMIKPINLNAQRQMVVTATGNPVISGIDIPPALESHNDQTSIAQANGGEGTVKGWGGSIMDKFMGGFSALNAPLASVSNSGLPVFTSGNLARTFTIDRAGIIKKVPDHLGLFGRESLPAADRTAVNDIYLASMQSGEESENDYSESSNRMNVLLQDFQPVLNFVPEITTPPVITGNSPSGTPYGNALFLTTNGLYQTLRLLLANNPNRGGTVTREGTLATIETEVTEGVANRAAGSTLVTVTAANHRLFSSSNSSDTDKVIVTGADATPPVAGYKVTVLDSDEDNKFTFASSATTELVNAPVTFRIKHNLTNESKVFLKDVVGLDATMPTDGYPVTKINDTSFSIQTTESGTISTPLPLIFKVVDLSNQLFYVTTPGIKGWDTHDSPVEQALCEFGAIMTWFSNVLRRFSGGDIVTFISSEFGRTTSTNSAGTDHGWSNNYFVFGKPVLGNKIAGDLMDFDPAGPHALPKYLMPTTSIFQYGATFAKWMGLSDAEVLEAFPDISNWAPADWYLDIL